MQPFPVDSRDCSPRTSHHSHHPASVFGSTHHDTCQTSRCLVTNLARTAAGYKYDLVKLSNPSVNVPVGTNSGGTLATDGFTFVATKSDVAAGLGATTNTFEHTLTDASALYIVRIWSWNGNDQTGVATGWSAVIGTGEPQKCSAGLTLAAGHACQGTPTMAPLAWQELSFGRHLDSCPSAAECHPFFGTGATPAKPSIISVQDGLDRLTVKFSQVANAIK